MLVLLIVGAIFVVSSGLAALTGKALWETIRCFGKELYWDVRTSRRRK